MSSEDKKISLKVAYGYFQEAKWERALEEYRKLLDEDPGDANLHNMIAEIHARRGAATEAVREYMACARLQAGQKAWEKALGTCKRAIRQEAGNPEALAMVAECVAGRLAEARAMLSRGECDAAHDAAQRLLDHAPANLDIHKLLDDCQADRLRRQVQAAPPAPAEKPADPTREFVEKLYSLAESYLQAEDFDNAIESLVTILKFNPDEVQVRNRLQEVRDQLEKKRAAEEQWARMQAEEARKLEEAKRQQLEAEARARWEREEAEARERMEAELSALSQTSASEQDIIERAAMEMRRTLSQGGAPAGEAAPSPRPEPSPEPSVPEIPAEPSRPEPPSAPVALDERAAAVEALRLRERFEREAAEREARFKAEAETLREQLRREREEAENAIREREQQMKDEAEMLRRQIEVARLEAEAKAREAAARELAKRMEEEQREVEERLARERQEFERREQEFQQRMESLMREQAARLEQQVREKALADLKAQMETENRQRQEAEQAARAREAEAMEALKLQRENQKRAEEQARVKAEEERLALDKLRQDQEARKQAIIAEALRRQQVQIPGAAARAAEAPKASRRISDALKAAATKHIETDHSALLAAAHSYMEQDLLQDAMRACQKVLEVDPENADVKAILKEIFKRRGL